MLLRGKVMRALFHGNMPSCGEPALDFPGGRLTLTSKEVSLGLQTQEIKDVIPTTGLSPHSMRVPAEESLDSKCALLFPRRAASVL